MVRCFCVGIFLTFVDSGILPLRNSFVLGCWLAGSKEVCRVGLVVVGRLCPTKRGDL